MNVERLVSLCVICACLMARPAAAQETIHYGTIGGRVSDPQGAVVPGATVTTRQTETNSTRETVTDLEGRFRFPYLRVGPYEVTVRAPGFADATRVVTVTLGSAFDLPVALAVAGLGTSVTVSGEATVLEAARTQIAGISSIWRCWCRGCRQPTSGAPSSSPRRRRSRGRASR
jgi:hypothetical protein